MRTKGRTRRVVRVSSIPPTRPNTSNWDHILLLDCGHTVTRHYPKNAKFTYSECPHPNCPKTVEARKADEIACSKTVIEIGVEVTDAQRKGIEAFLSVRKIPFYVEPQRARPWYSLEELEADCEGK